MGLVSGVDRVRMTGPLVSFVEVYAAELASRGYAPLTVVSEVRQVARFSGWMQARGLSTSDLDVGEVEAFLSWQRSAGRWRSSWSRPGLACFLEVLRDLGVVEAERSVVGSPTDRLLGSFERYLLTERAFAAGTVAGYSSHARVFVAGLPAGSGGLARVTAGDVTAAVRRRASSGVSASATRFFVSALRAFLRFCFTEGLTEVDLSQAALFASGRRGTPLPRAIGRADAAALLSCCDRRSALGRRDYAMLVLLLRLGLRGGEVARLVLDDIDWHAGEVVVHGKTARADRLPLPADVGEAIVAYLKRGRPVSDRRELFLRANAPFTPIASKTVGSTVRRACRRAGIPEVGTHRLRHTAACEMIAANVPLLRVAQVLRHQSLQTTAIYARVDLDQLRPLALPWPGSKR